jgi:DNA polymerase-4
LTDSPKIIHIDMDAFYASVEQRDRPELRGKPVIVGGDPDHRGVVAACSYEARKFGIHSAMSAKTAHHRCPHAVFLRPRFEVYQAVSAQIRRIFLGYTDQVEPLSLDEAFLDVTENRLGNPSATRIAERIRCQIRQETGLTGSAGVSFNKFLAKIASDENKPDGLTVIPPERAAAFIAELPVRKFFGVGPATEQRMHALGIYTGADLRAWSRAALLDCFGKAGAYYYGIARGHDPRPVTPHRIRKSLGKETTLPQDIDDTQAMGAILEGLAHQVEGQLLRHGLRGATVTLKVKYFDFQTLTRSRTGPGYVQTADLLLQYARQLLSQTEAGEKKVRLLGITVSNFEGMESKDNGQLPLPFP